ncbi:hypothetical protein Ahy_A02g009980 [Arachis hypogaea]|uniref:Polygalacturonase n=1 Tax=Arachis hypogaea TaxID=3818 RepID=A0A445EIT8_ARAHY|nr:hypothetical protein Ahy_A02g009980 [Arachis hypogaea]
MAQPLSMHHNTPQPNFFFKPSFASFIMAHLRPKHNTIPLLVIKALVHYFLFTLKTTIASYDDQTLNVIDFGAKPGGEIDSSRAFLDAWESACNTITPSTIYVPQGRFLIGKVVFKGSHEYCKSNGITMKIDGALVAPSNYDDIGNDGNWLLFDDVNGVSIIGGVLDGQGNGLWACKRFGKRNCPMGATNLGFTNSNNIVINGVTSLNSEMYHIVIDRSKNVKVEGVRVSASGNSPNTDGIHVQLSSFVTIIASNIATGDDCISIGPGTTNFVGSLGKELEEAGAENVTVKTVTFTGTENGVRIKSWGRPSNGFARNIIFQHLTMINVQNPIVIDQNYCPNEKGCPGQNSGVKISNVMYQDIHGTSATEVAVRFNCSPRNPCNEITLEDVKLTFQTNKQAQASCIHAQGITSGFVQPSACFSSNI